MCIIALLILLTLLEGNRPVLKAFTGGCYPPAAPPPPSEPPLPPSPPSPPPPSPPPPASPPLLPPAPPSPPPPPDPAPPPPPGPGLDVSQFSAVIPIVIGSGRITPWLLYCISTTSIWLQFRMVAHTGKPIQG